MTQRTGQRFTLREKHTAGPDSLPMTNWGDAHFDTRAGECTPDACNRCRQERQDGWRTGPCVMAPASLTIVITAFRAAGLFKVLPGIVSKQADDAECCQAGGTSEDPDEGSQAVDFADDLVLLLLFIGVGAVEEELILLVTGDLSTICNEKQEADGDHPPDDQHGRKNAHSVRHGYLSL